MLHVLYTPAFAAHPRTKAFGYGSSDGYRSSFQPSDLSQQTSSTKMAKSIKMKRLWHSMMQTALS